MLRQNNTLYVITTNGVKNWLKIEKLSTFNPGEKIKKLNEKKSILAAFIKGQSSQITYFPRLVPLQTS
ncbi:MAG: hypothetical protein KAZ36_13215, partial [Bacteroidales bacterium]|nr:hypothetical protein [Bacteroidales bacterium]